MTDEQEKEYVYAIAHPHDFVKIGHSKDPQQRLKDHQTSSPYELWIVVQIPVPDGPNAEQALHEHFSDQRVRGEWFELDYEDYDMLADLVKMASSNHEFKGVEAFREWQARKREALL